MSRIKMIGIASRLPVPSAARVSGISNAAWTNSNSEIPHPGASGRFMEGTWAFVTRCSFITQQNDSSRIRDQSHREIPSYGAGRTR